MSMTIALFVSDKLPLTEIEAALRREGLSPLGFRLTAALSPDIQSPPLEFGILIANDFGVVNLGEQTEQVRRILGAATPLILCVAEFSSLDRETLSQCGASKIVTPQSWKAGHVSERIISELALARAFGPGQIGGLRGASIRMRELYSDIERLAPLAETVLLIGETGTGKELVARELHNLSVRTGPYMPINCPEISPELISSELFGHVKGAFTGADKTRVGLIASAANGTVFLDEIGDLDLPSQAKLLRVLEDRTIRKVGANVFEPVNARIVLATNRDLRVACEEGSFRADLYERIRGFILEIPPLRLRKSDIPLLAHHFVNEYNREYGTSHRIEDASEDCLFRYDWPGNVRELRGVIRRASAYANADGCISAWVLQESVRRPEPRLQPNAVPFDPAVDSWMDIQNRAEKAYFSALLKYTGGKRESAMKLSGLQKTQFFLKLKKLSNRQD